jgi:asparagine synthase (glutamine-hydrolysing)
MCNEDGSVWITFNGEIYNFLELRSDLKSKGHEFRSRTDTEVIVHLWEEENVLCVNRLRGMFAFAIWDDRDKTLFLARDRIGKKPLFYAMLSDRFLFGSEIKAILQDSDFVPEPDLEAIHHYLTYQSVPAPYCAFMGVKKLSPAHYLKVKNGEGSPRRYWQLSYQDKLQVRGQKCEESLKEQIVEKLCEATRIRLMSDVPLGAFLSGGIDSSMITAIMAGLMDQPVKTFSIGFEQEEYSEVKFARMVADRYGTDHHEFIVTPDAQAIFPELVWHYNEPFADSSSIPTYYVCQLARQHVTVVLNGDGGDENFGGYQRYFRGQSFWRCRHIWEKLDRRLHPEKYESQVALDKRMWPDTGRPIDLTQDELRYYFTLTHFHESYQADLYTDDMKMVSRKCPAIELMLSKYRASDAWDFLDATLNVDLSLYLPDTLMTKVDIASMAHSLEARSPFLDHEFLEFTARIPPEFKLFNGSVSKYILKKLADDYLPAEVIYRPKMGFGVPIDHWFREELRDMVRETLLSPRSIGRGYFRREYVESLLDCHQNLGESWQYPIWNLLMLELWHQMFIDKTLNPPQDHIL